jgi:hypothetical protein
MAMKRRNKSLPGSVRSAFAELHDLRLSSSRFDSQPPFRHRFLLYGNLSGIRKYARKKPQYYAAIARRGFAAERRASWEDGLENQAEVGGVPGNGRRR